MKFFPLSLLVPLLFCGASEASPRKKPGRHSTNGYYRKDGTYVHSYVSGSGPLATRSRRGRSSRGRSSSIPDSWESDNGDGPENRTRPSALVPELYVPPQEATREPSWVRQQRLERSLQTGRRIQSDGSSETSYLVGKCTAVIDGDTLQILVGRAPKTIHLNGSDAPELDQDFGAQAKSSLSSLALGKTVTVYPVATLPFGQVRGWVFIGSRNLSSEQIRLGLAWWYQEDAPTEVKLSGLQEDARRAGIGLWSNKLPISPWQWRLKQSINNR